MKVNVAAGSGTTLRKPVRLLRTPLQANRPTKDVLALLQDLPGAIDV
jgi:hypothetical protein